MSEIETVVCDIGSTYTKGVIYGPQGYLARAQAPTTVENVEAGVNNVLAQLTDKLAVGEINPEHFFSTSSAAGGLRMVAMGYMPRVTAKAAKEVAMASGAKILEIISSEETPGYRKEILKETAPDIILLAGGTDGGDEESLRENAEVIIESEVEAVIILAGNIKAQPEIAELLTTAGYRVKKVPNVMPTIHQLNSEPAREAIHEEFIRQITKAEGLKKILDLITNDKVIPTPGAVLLAAELLAKGTFRNEGLGGLIVIDLGGATTDIHSILPEMDELEDEEKGLVVTNEQQVAYRTVEGNLGLRVSAQGIVDTVGEDYILDKINQEDKAVEFREYIKKVAANPEYVAEGELEISFDQALAIAAIEMALKRHAGYISQEHDPAMGMVPGTPVGRDLREVETIIGVGGIFTHLDEDKIESIITRALEDTGISLLPEEFDFYWDQNYSLFSIGVLAEQDPGRAFELGMQQLAKL